MWTIMSRVNRDYFISAFPMCMPFTSASGLGQTLSVRLIVVADSCLVPGLREKCGLSNGRWCWL